MTDNNGPRGGSLQFYPRVRAKKILPRVNWGALTKERGLLAFIGYKAGMKSAFVKDNTPNSMTKGQRIIIPVTVIECPTMKIFSIRFFKDKKLIGEVLNEEADKELKRKLKLPKQIKKKIEDFTEADDLRIIVYSQVKKTGIKKTPDISEIGLTGSYDEKLEFVKANLKKEISIKDVFASELVDVHGVTKGKGTQGPMKRYGLTLRSHKSEKGRRGPGSGGPWHPSRVSFREPKAGQMGYFTRIVYNSKIVSMGNINEKDINPSSGFKHFGKIKTDYVLIMGSVQGPVKRQLLISAPSRGHKTQSKKNYELIELR
ncbi:MAG: 50S ribosomal protein L3 [Candidatus Pacearchaeota archaeon]